MYKNYVQRLLFLHNMVTKVMHLAINVYLDGQGESLRHILEI